MSTNIKFPQIPLSYILKDFRDPIILKYSLFSLIIASAVSWGIGHIVFERGLNYFFNLLPIQQWLPDFKENYSGILSFVLSFWLFSLAMPIITAVIYPLMGFFQILFFESFANEFQKKYYYKYNTRRMGLFNNLFIFFKWTFLKVVIFLFLAPLFHLPGVGWVFHLFLVTLWIVLIYNEIVQKKYSKNMTFFRCLRSNIKSLAKITAVGMTLNYFIIWCLLYISFVFPPVKPLMLFLLIIVVISGNYILAAEFIRACINNEIVFSKDLVVSKASMKVIE
jgi:hypothetical protein